MKVTKGSIVNAIREARHCSFGHLYLHDGKAFFYQGTDTVSRKLIEDFCLFVRGRTMGEVIKEVQDRVDKFSDPYKIL